MVDATTRRGPAREPSADLPPMIDDITDITEEPIRTATCECGAHLVGNGRRELFEAAQSHLAHHHPELLGAVGADVVSQMAQVRPGAVSA